MKKIIKILTFILLTLPITLNAYTTNEYEITIPESFKESKVKNTFEDKDGNNINIQITEQKAIEYTDENLNLIVDKLKDSLEESKPQVKENLLKQTKEAYSSELSNEEIEKIVNKTVDSMKYEENLEKEVTTFTKNNYKCFYYKSNLMFGTTSTYGQTFQTFSNNKLYTLTINSTDINFFDKQEIKDAIESFTISNYQEPQKDNTTNKENIINLIYSTIILLALISVAIYGYKIMFKKLKERKRNNKK